MENKIFNRPKKHLQIESHMVVHKMLESRLNFLFLLFFLFLCVLYERRKKNNGPRVFELQKKRINLHVHSYLIIAFWTFGSGSKTIW